MVRFIEEFSNKKCKCGNIFYHQNDSENNNEELNFFFFFWIGDEEIQTLNL